MARPASYYLRRFETFRADRSAFDVKWQLVSDYILPRRDFSVTQRKGQLRPFRVTSSLATHLNTRLAAFVLGYWLDGTRPWLLPNVAQALARRGASGELDDASSAYLDQVAWTLFGALMRPKAGLRVRGGSMLKEWCAFGCGVLWQGRRRGFGPSFNARSVQSCWWSENEHGIVDVLYYKMSLPLYRVFERWPAAQQYWPSFDPARGSSEQDQTEILLCCEPRPGGQAGAVAAAKPFEFSAVSVEKGAVLDETGYDSFPYHVYRYDPQPGQTYAEGPGCHVLPDVMVLNHLQQIVEAGASDRGMPPLAMPARMFGKALDRRPGAINHFNPASLGLTSAKDALVKLDFTGDLSDAVRLIPVVKEDIQLGYFADWMKLRETGDMTAEEVNTWKDINFQGMDSIIANLEMTSSEMGDRSLEICNQEGIIPPPPSALSGADVDWEYAGPLSLLRRSRQVNAGLQLLNARGVVAQQDPDAAHAVDAEAVLRGIADGLAAAPNQTNSHQAVVQVRAARQHQEEQQANAQKLALAAKAASDGGSAAQSIAGAAQAMGAGGGGAPPPGAANFAPVAPFPQAA